MHGALHLGEAETSKRTNTNSPYISVSSRETCVRETSKRAYGETNKHPVLSKKLSTFGVNRKSSLYKSMQTDSADQNH